MYGNGITCSLHFPFSISTRAETVQRYSVIPSFVHSFIHSDYFYSASSSPLLLRGAPDTARILFQAEASQATANKGLAQDPYMAAIAGFEPMTLWTKCDESTNEPPRPKRHLLTSSVPLST